MDKTLTKNKPIPIINEQYMELTIKEMWEAVSDIKCDDEREIAIADANRIEQNIRQKFAEQEAMRDSAPDALDVLFNIIKYNKGVCLGKSEKQDEIFETAIELLRQHDKMTVTIMLRHQLTGSYHICDLDKENNFVLTKNVNKSIVFKNSATANKYFKFSETIHISLPGFDEKQPVGVIYEYGFKDADDEWYNK